MTSLHWKPSLTGIFLYNLYSNSVDYHSTDILPPVSEQGRVGNCSAHALICAVEARSRKVRTWAPAPKSIWRLSLRDLLNTLEAGTNQFEGFSLDHLRSAMTGSGVGMYDDHEARDWMDNEHPAGFKIRLSRIDVYTSPGQVGGTIQIDDVMREIANDGPVLASFYMDWDFSHWNKEAANSLVYTGMSRENLSEQDLRRRHFVSLVGYGGGTEVYFIAQNSHGCNWGDSGYFLLDPSCVDMIGVPIL